MTPSPSPPTSYRPSAASLAGLAIDGIIAVLVDRPRFDETARARRVTDIWSLIAAFHPHDPFEIMVIGQCLLFNDLVSDGARDVLNATEDRAKTRARAHTIAMSRELNKHMRSFRAARARAAIPEAGAARFGAAASKPVPPPGAEALAQGLAPPSSGTTVPPSGPAASDPGVSARMQGGSAQAEPPPQSARSATAWAATLAATEAAARASSTTYREELRQTTAHAGPGAALATEANPPRPSDSTSPRPSGSTPPRSSDPTPPRSSAPAPAGIADTVRDGAPSPDLDPGAARTPSANPQASPPSRPEPPAQPSGTGAADRRGAGAYLPNAKAAARAGPQSS